MLALQRQAGNQAVGAALARPPRATTDSVADAILRDAPATLPFVSGDWLRETQAELDAGEDTHDTQVETARLLDADDILAVQPFNRAIEDRFRRALHATLLTKPVTVALTPHGIFLRWGDDVLQHTRGRIGFKDLMRTGRFGEAYHNDVTNAPELVQLRQGISTIDHLVTEVSYDHQWRIDKDAQHPVVAWIARHAGAPSLEDKLTVIADVQAHPERGPVEQRLRELDAPRPDIEEWDKPTADLRRARQMLAAGQFELALWAFAQAEQGALAVARRYERYEAKVTEGAGVAITWLNRLKMAGTIAAGIATGGSSLLVQVGVAAGYSLLRDGAGQVSELAQGLRADIDVGGLAKQAAVEGAMAYLGGVTQSAFTKTLTVRFGARVTELYGPVVSQRLMSAGAAATSAFYTAPAGIVLNRIMAGGPLPKSLDELGDMIAEEALRNAALDIGIGVLTHGAHAPGETPEGAAPERATPAAPEGAAPGPEAHPAAADAPVMPNSATTGPERAPAGPHVLELAGRVGQGDATAHAPLLDALGPWEEAMWHLRNGTGPAAQIGEAMRLTLMQRLRDHRAGLVRQMADQFGAEPMGKPSEEPESDLDLNVKGDDAGTRAVRIKGYLDQVHPGWERRYRMAVLVDAGRMGSLSDAIARLPAPARRELAVWQAQRAEAMQLTRLARAAGTPAERAELLGRIADPELRRQAESLAALDAAGLRDFHDRLLAATDRQLAAVEGAAPDPEKIKQALQTQMWANALDPEAYVSAGAIHSVVLGRRIEPAQAYEAVLDQVGMIHHLADAAGGMRGALRRYETFKYIQRICDQLLATGMHDPRLTFLRNHAELVYNVERRATASAQARTLSEGDLTGTADHRGVRHEDLGETPGVSDAFLADTHAMLDGLLREQLPQLRQLALGDAAAGPPPVTLPPLGPEPAPALARTSPAPRGLSAPDAMERLADAVVHEPALPEGASVREQATAFYTAVAGELTRLGVPAPRLVVRDMGDPGVKARYDPTVNVVFVNEGAREPNGRPTFDGSPLARQRLRNVLVHESRHAEQWFQALRYETLSERDPAKLAEKTGVRPELIDAALRQPSLRPNTRERDEAALMYHEIFGPGREQTSYGQNTVRWGELREAIEAAHADAQVAQTALGRIRWYELWKLVGRGRLQDRLTRAQEDVVRHMRELDDRYTVYRNLEHEQDARAAERLATQAIGSRELAAAARRHADAKATLAHLQSTLPEGEHRAEVEALATALQAYSETLERVGAMYAKFGVEAPR